MDEMSKRLWSNQNAIDELILNAMTKMERDIRFLATASVALSVSMIGLIIYAAL